MISSKPHEFLNKTLNDSNEAFNRTYGLTVILIASFLFSFSEINAQSDFITTWQTTTASEAIAIPTFTSETYDYTVDWGDGTVESGFTGDASHTYTETGTYTVAISGTFPRIYFNNGNDGQMKDKILTIEQWGEIQWSSMEQAFSGCSQLHINASDAPDLSSVISLQAMFSGCLSLNESIDHWNVSTITNLSFMFDAASSFNQPLSSWDVSNVTGMYATLRGTSFNQDISSWNVSNVQGFGYMFAGAVVFNQPLGSWNMSSAISLGGMFVGASAFNQDISNWDVSNVQSIGALFQDASSFNQDISNWDVSNVIYTYDNGAWRGPFDNASSFNQSLATWDISKMIDMTDFFNGSGLSAANYDATLEGWARLDPGETQIPTSLNLGATGLEFCEGADARQRLIDDYGWTFTGDDFACDGLISYYPFSGNAMDSTNNNNDGTVNGAVLTTDRFGNANSAYFFDGVDDYIFNASPTSLDNQDHTVAAWVQSKKAGFQGIAGLIGGAGNNGYYLNINSAGNYAMLEGNGTTWGYAVSNDVYQNDNQWHFVVSTRTGGIAKIYVDGILQDGSTAETMSCAACELVIGYSTSASQYFGGSLDDIRIYSRALSDSEIKGLYSEGGYSPPAEITVSDVYGNNYSGVVIGTQVWMGENLRTTMYNDGSSIPNITDNIEWGNLTSPSLSWWNNDSSTYATTFGALYNWYTVDAGSNGDKNVCPSGWHVSSDAEWSIMYTYLINNGYNYDGTTSGNKIGKSLAKSNTWNFSANIGAVGNTDYPAVQNSTNFSAIPGGDRNVSGDFVSSGTDGYHWTTTESSSTNAWYWPLFSNYEGLSRYNVPKTFGFSIRCVRDQVTQTATNIKSFSLPNAGQAVIDTVNHTITIPGFSGHTSLVPTITLSDGATISPVAGIAQDFTNTFIYTVTAEDRITKQVWTVYATLGDFISESHDLNDNQVPEGWTLQDVTDPADNGSVEIANGRLNGYITDGIGYLWKKGQVPEGTQKVVFEWDGYLDYSLWGMTTPLFIHNDQGNYMAFSAETKDNTLAANEIIAKIFSNSTGLFVDDLSTFTIGQSYHFKVVADSTGYTYSGYRSSDGGLQFSIQTSNPDFYFYDIEAIWFRVYSTTDNNTWMDNPSVIFVKDTDLVAYYPFSGDAFDESGNGNNGTENGGVALTNDRFGNANSAYSFDGIDDYIEIADDNSLDQQMSLTISTWLNFQSGGTGNPRIVEKGPGASSTGPYFFTTLGTGSVRTLQLGLKDGVNQYDLITTETISENTWNHLVASYDGTNMAIFINGKLSATQSIGSINLIQTDGNINIGRKHTGAALMKGQMDEFRIYDRALSTSEIVQLYIEDNWGTPILHSAQAIAAIPGNQIRLYGKHFAEPNTTISFGGSVVIPDSARHNVAYVTVPNMAYGLVDLSVSNDYGTSDPIDFTVIHEGHGGYFTYHEVGTNLHGYSVDVIDLDKDGDFDFIAGAGVDNKVMWFENDGNQQFTEHEITSSIDFVTYVLASDMDSDGDIDIVVGANAGVFVLSNNGYNAFTTAEISSASVTNIRSMDLGDVDGDGNIDIVVGDDGNDYITLYKNMSGSFSEEIIASPTVTDWTMGIDIFDVDTDGDMDVVYSSMWYDKFGYLENDGNESFTERNVATTIDANHVIAFDLDQDGDTDFVNSVYADGQVTWYENVSGSYSQRLVSATTSGAEEIKVTDINGDGNWDIVSSNRFGSNQIRYFLNDGSQNFSEILLPDSLSGTLSVYPADVDRDGDMDIVAISATNRRLAWFENQSSNEYGLVGYYPFNGNANDESGNGNHGVENGNVTLTTDRFGKVDSAYLFDGSFDYINIGSSTDFDFTNNFSVGVWLKSTTLNTLNTLVRKGQYSWSLEIRTIENAQFGADGISAVALGLTSLADDRWHHVIGTYDGSTISVYVDGVLDDSKSTSGNSVVNGTEVWIGGNSQDDNRWFTGTMDDVRLYNRALSMEEVVALYAEESRPFITTWQTTTANESITIPTSSGETYDYMVDWGDGTSSSNVTGDASHTYTTAGTYTIAISGTFPRIYFNNGSEGQQVSKIQSIDQWGDIAWTSFEAAFMGCTDLQLTATDAPDLSIVTSLRRVFQNAANFDGNVANWDVSGITDFFGIFYGTSFTGDVSGWNVSSAMDMQGVFGFTPFNGDVSNWNVSSVVNMSFMFNNTTNFNQPLESWNVANTQTMFNMFEGAKAFNQPLNGWETTSLLNIDGIFKDTEIFNQPLDQWNVGNVTNMVSSFNNAKAFDQSLAAWDISSVTTMEFMLDVAVMSSANYDATLQGWAILDVGETQIPTGITLGASGLTYCAGGTARNLLTGSYGWTITGDAEDCPTGLMAHYKMDGTALDTTSYSHDGVANGGIATTLDRFDVANGSYQFDGSNDYIDLGDPYLLKLDNDLTISAWVKWDGTLLGDPIIVRVANGEAEEDNNLYMFLIDGGGKLRVDYEYGAGIEVSMIGKTTLPTGQWTHVALTRDVSDSSDIALYINGIQDTVRTRQPNPSGGTVASQKVWIGATDVPFSLFFDGAMDDVQLYNYAMTSLQIDSLYDTQRVLSAENAITGLSHPNLVNGSLVINDVNFTVDAEVTYGTDLTILAPVIDISNMATISPLSGTSTDFTNPVVYTVTADNGTPQDWTVSITNASNTATDVLTFSFPEETVTVTPDAVNHTVDIEVAYGTDVTSLVATFTLSDGATAAVNATPQVSATTANDFTNPVTYTVTAEDGPTTQDWIVTVTEAPANGTDILSYSFTEQTAAITPDDVNHTIDIEVANGTDLTSLVATFSLSSNATAAIFGTSQISGTTANDFSSPVTYTITAEDGTTTQDWTVTVTEAPANGTDILSFSFTEQTAAITPDNVNHTVAIEVANGTDLSNLVATFSLSINASASISGTAQISGTTANDFSSPVTYIITAEDETTTQDWTVTVTVAPGNETDILSYSFTEQTAAITPDNVNHTVDIVVANGTDLTGLVATFSLSANATASVSGTPQTSGTTPNDFSSPVTYTITAEDGTTTQDWTVTVTVAPGNETDILSYSFTEQTAAITPDNVNHTVDIEVTSGTDLTSLVATFSLSVNATASVSGTPQTSGTTANDFSSPVTYTITAEDGTTTQDWTVTVTEVSSIDTSPPTITDKTANSVDPGSAVSIVVSLVDDESGIASANVLYRSISTGDSFVSSDLVAPVSGSDYTFSIPSTFVNEIGLEYKYEVTNGAGLMNTPVLKSVSVNSSSSGFNIPISSFGSDLSNYQIVAVPLSLTNNTVANVFDELMPYDATKWRMYHYQNGSNQELSGSSAINPGLGYWLIIKESKSLNSGPGTSVQANTDEPFSVNLQQGWNQIGNPYDFNLSWADVQAANPGLPGLRKWDNSMVDATVLDAMEGGFVNVSSATNLKFPVTKNTAINGRVSGESEFNRNPLSEPNWEVYLYLDQGNLKNRISGVGMNVESSDGYDPLDGLNMPHFFNAYLEVNHTKQANGSSLSKDIIPTSENHIWEFSINSNSDQLLTFSWDNSYFGDNESQLYLWDVELQRSVDMRSTDSYSFSKNESKSFQVLFGSPEFILENIDVTGFIMHNIWPNPIDKEMNMSFTLPVADGAQEVAMDMVDMMGRKVWSYNNKFDPGYHEISWIRESIPAGIYVITLKFDGINKQTRLILK